MLEMMLELMSELMLEMRPIMHVLSRPSEASASASPPDRGFRVHSSAGYSKRRSAQPDGDAVSWLRRSCFFTFNVHLEKATMRLAQLLLPCIQRMASLYSRTFARTAVSSQAFFIGVSGVVFVGLKAHEMLKRAITSNHAPTLLGMPKHHSPTGPGKASSPTMCPHLLAKDTWAWTLGAQASFLSWAFTYCIRGCCGQHAAAS